MSDDARVPFSAIGVLLILFSVSISTFILKADIEMAKVILSENSDYAFFFAISDLERALNYAGVFSLHEVGKSPIMNSSMKNFERAIFLAEEKFSELVKMNYQNDSFIYEDKIINAERIGDIEFSPLVMNLSRKFSPPILKPRGKYETYYIASVPLILSMKEVGKEQMEISREIDSPILSRYPLLKELIQEWEGRLRNEIMIQSTAFFQGITLAKGYSQYFLGKPKNVVSNDDLSLLINGVLLLDQVWVFNSVDSGALEEYLLRAGKIEPVISPLQAAGEEYEIMKEELISAKPVVDYVHARVDEEIERIARDVYTAEFQLDVKREMIFYKEGSHEPCNTDLGAGRWEVESFSCDSLEMDERRVGGKDCRISYSRLHEWKLPKTCRKTVCSGEGEERRCKKVSYDCSIYCSAKDERKDEVKVEVRVNWYSKYLLGMEECHKERDFDEDKCEFSVFCERKGRELKDDISDVFHAKIYDGIYDRNLEDVAENYLRNYYEPNWRTVVSYCGIDGRCPSDFPFRRRITGEVPQEIKLVARHLIDEMKREHEQIKLDEKINFESCPVPSELLKAASRDFILKIEGADVQKHLEDGRFRAASAKVIWISANWWVNELKKEILSSFGDGARMAEEKLGKIKSSSIMNLAKKFLNEEFHLPHSTEMILEYGEYGTLEYWNESIVIEIDQEPDFLDPFEAMEVEKGGGKEKIYTLKLRNRNLFADASPLQKGGIPILPPPEPWIITINGWIIDVEGEYVRYEVRDGEQVVVREKKKIYDGQNKLIGYNTPIRFSFTTGTFIAVPPGPQGVGDRLGGGTCEASPGWKC